MESRFHIYHSNDLHSHFENWPKMMKYMERASKLHKMNNEQMYLFDVGDHLDRSNPLTEASMGKVNVALLNEAHYDAVTIGNNEGITLSNEDLNELYLNADFSILVANLYSKHGTRPDWVRPYEIKTHPSGMKIAVIGLTVPFYTFYDELDWNIVDPIEELENILKEINGSVDFIILLSHLGLSADEEIAKRFHEINLILGGHTHHVLEHGKRVNETLLCGAGKYGDFIGHVVVDINNANGNLISVEAEVISVDHMEECSKTRASLQTLSDQSSKRLNLPIATLTERLKIDWFSSSPFSDLLAEALSEWCDTDLSMVNAGVLLDSLHVGDVTKRDLHRVCPHPINPCKITLKGNELKEVIKHSFTERMQELRIKGLGFRGEVMGRMIFHGIEVETQKLSDGLIHVHEMKIAGRPIDPEKNYEIATIDMFTFGKLYPEIRDAKHKKYYMPEMLRDVIEWKLKGEN